ncbi:GNAT family N-acetyltransferase [Mycobacterium marinum]|uniref:GNAT family N-acetyltransferase n=1 Tax=Mycobacterium marinum TaxID=1781 RepID=UPI000E3BDD97|nr:GNAT family N-acetyltransferase [Mycobacterium marinum]MDC8984669.1 GNAT family N-acetyltransferase [Mycobacterium marinum]MDC8996327.1 GNAT family N-acetyltransferase [Mycobacterium marinum]MDC9001920.1 GNAT family N-acetyltransferase [Mycobacterium marinum]MDC9012695.1 GNAT family N-acetyltransferase [Mycobacterium marinum]QQW34278.1 GNAT family N-acetyltransferase [Mycobacterium marinum]
MATADDEILTGPRLILRPLRPTDADVVFFEVTSDDEVMRYLSCNTHSDVEQTRHFITELCMDDNNRGWIINWRSTGDPVGFCTWIRPEGPEVQLGISLGRRWWGQHVTSEALDLLIEQAQQDPSVHRVWAACHVDNIGAARALERNGLSMQDRLERYCVFPNLGAEPQDAFRFARTLR